MRTSIVASVFFGFVVLFAGSASAVVINVDFNWSGATVPSGDYSGQGAYSDPGNNFWNGVGFSGTTGGTSGALTASNGTTSTAVTLTIGPLTDAFDYGTGNPGANPTSFRPALFNDGIYINGSSTFSFNNVPTGTYDVYVYSLTAGYHTSNSYNTEFTIGATSQNVVQPSATPSSFVAGETYVVFSGVSPTAGVIAGTWEKAIATNAIFNGIQLVSVAVPEPNTIALACIGAVGLFRVVRRRTAA
jgi:hypothetical protein